MGIALLVVLDKLTPAERVAFVLHDVFEVPFAEIGDALGRAPAAVRKLASRARRHVIGSTMARQGTREQERALVGAFLAAARDGDLQGLVAVLDADVVFRADPAAVRAGAPEEVHGAEALATAMAGHSRSLQLGFVNGRPGLIYAPGGQPHGAFVFAIARGKITQVEMIAEPDYVRTLLTELL